MTCKPKATRQRLLEAAARAFAVKGFRNATVAEICAAAGANIAAVTYHFGGKENLYREAWRHAHLAALEKYPPDGGARSDAPPAKRLHGRIRAVLQRGLGDDGLEFRIMSHEMAHPTGLLRQVVHDNIRPLRKAAEGIVRELLGNGADDRTVRLCATSVVGPCLHLMRRQRMHRWMGKGPRIEPDRIDDLAEHFTTFALAGIRSIRRKQQRVAKPTDRKKEAAT